MTAVAALTLALVRRYADGGDEERAAIRALFDAHPGFRWAAWLPGEWHDVGGLRDRLILLAARDQGADARDELLVLRDLLTRARDLGIDARPVLVEVAAMASDLDRYGMGSVRRFLSTAAASC